MNNTTYYKKLSKIFSNTFIAPDREKDYWKQRECEFVCENSCICNIKKETPKYTGCVGDINTSIMVIGEAPSGTTKKGEGIIGGYFKDVTESMKSPLYIVKEFCIENYGKIPYFTDLCKCGVTRQANKEDLELRFEKCFDKFLIKEIEVVKPEIIFALGNGIKNLLLKNIDRIKRLLVIR
jgi:uracil-DNA glycosylase family 4